MPLRYVSRKAEEQIAEVADKLGYESLPPPGPIGKLEPEDLMPPVTAPEEREDYQAAMRHMVRAIDILFKSADIDPEARSELEQCKAMFEEEAQGI